MYVRSEISYTVFNRAYFLIGVFCIAATGKHTLLLCFNSSAYKVMPNPNLVTVIQALLV